MKLYQVMTLDLQKIAAGATAQDAARIMRDFNVGILPVMEGQVPIGAVTDRDLVLRVLCHECDPSLVPVRQVMTPDFFWMFEDDDLDDAIEAMSERKISRLFVKSRNGMLTGIVSAADIATLSTPERTADLMRALGSSYWQKHVDTISLIA